MIATIVAGLAAGYGVAIPVGAVGAYLVALSVRSSVRVGVLAALGVATADGVYAVVAVFGGSVAVTVLRPMTTSLRWGAALLLIGLAVRGTVKAVREYREQHSQAAAEVTPLSAGRAYVSLLAITMANPLTVLYFAALVLGNQHAAGAGIPERAAFILAIFTASASWQLTLAGGGQLLGRHLTGRRGRLATGLVSSAVLAGLALRSIIAA